MEKAGGFIGAVLGIVIYVLLKNWYLSLGMNYFLSIFLAIVTLIAGIIVLLIVGFLLLPFFTSNKNIDSEQLPEESDSDSLENEDNQL